MVKTMRMSAAVSVGVGMLGFGMLARARPPCDASDKVLQLATVQDVSYSFGDSLISLIPDVPTLEEDLAQMFHSLEIGVTSFSDKGTLPVGDPNGDYCYREDRAFDSASMVPVLESLRILSGRDWKESQFDAIKYAVLSDSLGWERGDYIDGKRAVRVALLATDALPHLKGVFPSWPDDDPRGCEFSDYPSVADIAEILEDNDTYLIVLTVPNIKNSWTNLLADVPRARVIDNRTIVGEIEEIICDLPPLPIPDGCGNSLARSGPARSTCAEVCGIFTCDDTDTMRISTSLEHCNAALDTLYSEPKVLDLELDLFPYAGGCNTFSLFGLRKTVLRYDTDGCDAQTGNSGHKDRVCCCRLDVQPRD